MGLSTAGGLALGVMRTHLAGEPVDRLTALVAALAVGLLAAAIAGWSSASRALAAAPYVTFMMATMAFGELWFGWRIGQGSRVFLLEPVAVVAAGYLPAALVHFGLRRRFLRHMPLFGFRGL